MAPAATAKPSSTAAASASARTHTRHSKKKAVAEEQAPQPPPEPPTLAESPPTAPQVTYRNGQLSIDARNATLAQILRAVQTQTGATIDIPGNASSERVVTQLGPGAPHDVLNTLLNGTKFDYIILGVTGDPGAVQRVILTPRQSSPMNNVNVAQNNVQVNQEAQDDDSPDEGVAVSEPEPEPQAEQPQVPPGAFRRPGFPGGGLPGQAPAFNNGNFNNGENNNNEDPNNNGAKSPEQLMQELQQMQQQQQQYQQQLNPANQQQPQQQPQ